MKALSGPCLPVKETSSCIERDQAKSSLQHRGYPAPSQTAGKTPDLSTTNRRSVMAAISLALIPVTARKGNAAQVGTGRSGDWSSPGLASPAENSAPEFFKTASGVKVQELAQGSGPGAESGDNIELEYVLRRTNGYFIYSTKEGVSFQPRDVPTGPLEMQLGDKSVIPGLQDALLGMRAGGKRRVLVPPELGYASGTDLQPTPPTFAAKRQILNHSKEALMFELQLVKIRNKGR